MFLTGTQCYVLISSVILFQYLKHVHEIAYNWIERYALLLCIFLVWTFAAILTAAGAYNHASLKAQQHCRTDRAYLMSSAPWYIIL
jgi:hypothetical protein